MSIDKCAVIVRDVPVRLRNQLKARAAISNKTLKQFIMDEWAAACVETIVIDGSEAVKKAEGS